MFDLNSISFNNIGNILLIVFIVLLVITIVFQFTKKQNVEGLTPIGASELENLVKRIQTANITDYDTLLMDKYRNHWEDLIFVIEEAIHIALFKNLQAMSQGYVNGAPTEEIQKLAERANIFTNYLDALNKQVVYIDNYVPTQK